MWKTVSSDYNKDAEGHRDKENRMNHSKIA